MGKSGLGLCMAANLGVRHQIPVALFTLEMSKSEVTQRMMCSEAKVESQRLRTGRLAPDDWPRLTAACDRLMKAPIYVDDTGATTTGGASLEGAPPEVARAEPRIDHRRLSAADGLDRTVERPGGLADLRALKVLARELDVPILAMSQLSRAVEQRHDKRPILSDLRDSGSIEQDADLVMFIYRDEYYRRGVRPAGDRGGHSREAPQRPDGRREASWLRRYAEFADLAAA